MKDDMKKPEYCTQNNGDCSTCSLANYGRDCQNNSIRKPGRPASGRPRLINKCFAVEQSTLDKIDAISRVSGESRGKIIDRMIGDREIMKHPAFYANLRNTEGYTQADLDRYNAALDIYLDGEKVDDHETLAKHFADQRLTGDPKNWKF